MNELHYGPLPTARPLLEGIRRAHQLGFRTIPVNRSITEEQK
jgi:hypothetical protein